MVNQGHGDPYGKLLLPDVKPAGKDRRNPWGLFRWQMRRRGEDRCRELTGAGSPPASKSEHRAGKVMSAISPFTELLVPGSVPGFPRRRAMRRASYLGICGKSVPSRGHSKD